LMQASHQASGGIGAWLRSGARFIPGKRLHWTASKLDNGLFCPNMVSKHQRSSPENAACPDIPVRTRRERVRPVASGPGRGSSDAPAWWWSTAIAAIDETATMPVEWCAILGVADQSTYAQGAEVFRNALAGQTYLPWSEHFPRKFKATEAA
jgi:hypothetical protein